MKKWSPAWNTAIDEVTLKGDEVNKSVVSNLQHTEKHLNFQR